jgi:hypothetical protein
LSPHVFYNVNNWQFAVEVEYTAAAFGEVQSDQRAKVVNASEAANFRSSLMIYFFF